MIDELTREERLVILRFRKGWSWKLLARKVKRTTGKQWSPSTISAAVHGGEVAAATRERVLGALEEVLDE